jgi:deoxycytidylate deaminase
VKIEGRHKRYVGLAKRLANSSPCPDHKHGAVLVRGGSVINWSINRNRVQRWAQKFRAHGCGHATHHAELGAILGIAREKTQGADVYVVRVNKRDNLLLSKPCPMCEEVLRHVGVKRVFYSVDDDTIECYRV